MVKILRQNGRNKANEGKEKCDLAHNLCPYKPEEGEHVQPQLDKCYAKSSFRGTIYVLSAHARFDTASYS